MRNKLVLPEGYDKYQGWNWTLCRMLAASKCFDVSTEIFPHAKFHGARNGNWSLFKINGKLIGLDTWDTLSPTAHYHGNGFFKDILKDVKMVIKIQYQPNRYWNEFTKDTGIPVSSWTVMPTRDFPLESFQWENKKHKWISTVTGKNNRFGRQPWSMWCEKQDDFYSSGEYLVNDKLDSYIDRLKECKWGMILKGKRGAEKNRRECEFTSCGIPLALNYDPYYPFDIKPGVHYVRLNNPEDLATLRDINPEPFAKASRQLYFDHFSSYGMAKTLIKITGKI